MTTLLAWLGNTDLRAAGGDVSTEGGPILRALQAREFQRIEILSDHGKVKTQEFAGWLAKQFKGRVTTHLVKLSSPTSFEDIYREADKLVATIKKAKPSDHLTFHLSPGTPAMAAVWMLLAKAKYGAELIESSREAGVKTVAVPFELAAEFAPMAGKSADEALARLSQGLPPESPEFSIIIYRCPGMKRVVTMAHRLALRDVPVLIQGESGTGKELFARAIHGISPRRAFPFMPVNCGAIPGELVDSELFGHEKGAFTGATTSRVGYFESADGGTLFLDEIGELPLASQVRLLRVLQDKEVTRVGATRAKKIDLRIVAATNRVLPVEVQQGRFREDLFHRLAVGVLVLPPLRDRAGDISLLIDALLDRINKDAASQPEYKHKTISVKAKKIILQYGWPGNIRELHNALLRASIWAPGEEISGQDMTEALDLNIPRKRDTLLDRPLEKGFSLPDLMGELARHYLDKGVSQSHGNKTEAARLLGLGSYQTLTNWLDKYGAQK